ncbi:MAG: BMP family ABC transporter substrate-binding protein [Pyrinomonadaceae bacterium]|nr:BMP family ABC transporter substrate-binding protein [Pyrinomonadaceae bacterium]MDQ3135576.1 BMP family ABC transporter substrate-binding protein [Acidobacteriota bacterium]
MLAAALCLLMAALMLTACNGGSSRASEDQSKLKVGIVFDIGGKDDRSFNAAAWDGVKRAAADFPILLRDVEPGDPTSIEPAMRAFAERGYDLIIGVGFAQTPIMQDVASDYPNTKFAIIDGVILKRDAQGKPIEGQFAENVASLVFKEHQGSYLVGMIAAKKSQTGTVGFIGGMDIPLIHKFATGYAEGAKSVNPNIRVIDNYVGINDAAWNNPGKGKELAIAQIGKGADVIFTAAGNSGLGAFDAAEQYGKLVIGVDANQNWVKPGYVLTSMVKRVDNAVYQIIQDLSAGKFDGGIHVYGLENDGVGYAMDQYNEKLIDPEVLKEVEAAKQKIIKGEIQVTDAMAK